MDATLPTELIDIVASGGSTAILSVVAWQLWAMLKSELANRREDTKAIRDLTEAVNRFMRAKD